jgi:hypothetical protein
MVPVSGLRIGAEMDANYTVPPNNDRFSLQRVLLWVIGSALLALCPWFTWSHSGYITTKIIQHRGISNIYGKFFLALGIINLLAAVVAAKTSNSIVQNIFSILRVIAIIGTPLFLIIMWGMLSALAGWGAGLFMLIAAVAITCCGAIAINYP